jgi:signal transduction histidine kinase
MSIIPKKRQFQWKLLSLSLTPVLLVIILLVYVTTRNTEKLAAEKLVVTGIAVLLLVGYCMLLASFIKKTRARIFGIHETIADLASGKFRTNATVTGRDELADIASSLGTLKSDLVHKTNFAEEIRNGNLEVSYQPESDDDQLGHAETER